MIAAAGQPASSTRRSSEEAVETVFTDKKKAEN